MSSNSNLRLPLRCVAAMALCLALSLACSSATERYGVDLSGRPVSDLGGPGIHFIVLVFAATDCPISNRYVPEIARLNKEFSSQGVRFWWVFPNASDNAHLVSQHNRDFTIHENSLLDVSQATTRRANATVTPEAAIFTLICARCITAALTTAISTLAGRGLRPDTTIWNWPSLPRWQASPFPSPEGRPLAAPSCSCRNEEPPRE